jgi:predicted transglutaminase-like cysteine proteinase
VNVVNFSTLSTKAAHTRLLAWLFVIIDMLLITVVVLSYSQLNIKLLTLYFEHGSFVLDNLHVSHQIFELTVERKYLVIVMFGDGGDLLLLFL